MPKLILPRKIRKRDGSIVAFEKEKIRYAIERAAFEVLQDRLKSITVSETVTHRSSRRKPPLSQSEPRTSRPSRTSSSRAS